MIQITKKYLLWLSMSAWLGLISMWLVPGFSYDWVLSLICFFIVFYKTNLKELKLLTYLKDYRFWLIFTPLVIHAALLVFESDGWIKVFHPNNLGDYSFHHHLSAYLQNATLWPENPMFSGADLTYAFGMNLVQAMWMDISFLSPMNVFVLFSIIFVTLSTLLSFEIGGWFLASIVFYSCGWGLRGFELEWKNLFLSSFLTQRSYIYVLPFGLLWAHRLYQYVLEKKEFSKKEVYLYGFLFGSLGMFHYHAAFVLGLISIFLYFARPTKNYFFIGLFAILIGSYFPLHAGWNTAFSPYYSSKAFFNSSWFVNSLPIFFMMCIFSYFLPKIRKYLLSSLVLFLIFQFFIFAPWYWDNTKLLIWVYLFAMLFVSKEITSHKSLKQISVFILCVFGFYQVYSYTFIGYEAQKIWQKKDLEALSKILPQDRGEVYWIYPTYNHPIYYFGRKVAIAYPGHLWSQGVNYKEKMDRLIGALTQGNLFKQELSKERVAYALYTDIEKLQFGLEKYQDLSLVKTQDGVGLYSVDEIQR